MHGSCRLGKSAAITLQDADVLITFDYSDLNVVHHLWQFADLEERRARREQSWSVPGWGETVHRTVPLIQTMKSRIMVPMPWSPIA